MTMCKPITYKFKAITIWRGKKDDSPQYHHSPNGYLYICFEHNHVVIMDENGSIIAFYSNWFRIKPGYKDQFHNLKELKKEIGG